MRDLLSVLKSRNLFWDDSELVVLVESAFILASEEPKEAPAYSSDPNRKWLLQRPRAILIGPPFWTLQPDRFAKALALQTLSSVSRISSQSNWCVCWYCRRTFRDWKLPPWALWAVVGTFGPFRQSMNVVSLQCWLWWAFLYFLCQLDQHWEWPCQRKLDDLPVLGPFLRGTKSDFQNLLPSHSWLVVAPIAQIVWKWARRHKLPSCSQILSLSLPVFSRKASLFWGDPSWQSLISTRGPQMVQKLEEQFHVDLHIRSPNAPWLFSGKLF